jgi:mono/diheme cytochrome c family protein
MSRAIRLALLTAAAAVLATPAFAQTTIKKQPIQPIADISGAGSYKAYCSVCHGPSAKGDGPAAKALVKPPSDLTQIAKRSNGKYNPLAVRSHIVGDTAVAAHGTRDMPMWGPVFSSADGSGATALRVKNLVDYIETIQAK